MIVIPGLTNAELEPCLPPDGADKKYYGAFVSMGKNVHGGRW